MKYMIERIRKMSYRNFFDKIGDMHRSTNKSRIVLFFDVVITCLITKCGYMDYYLLKMYEMTYKERKTYLNRGINTDLIKELNNREDMQLLNNKIKTNEIYNDYLRREWTAVSGKRINSFLKNNKKFIAKPSNGQCGKGIEIVETKNYKSTKDLISYLQKNNMDLLEEIVIQHKELNKINSSSVNTVRVVSILNDKVYFIGACCRFGNKNFVDNFESGGMTAKVDVDTGIVLSPAVDKAGNIFYKHPISNEQIQGYQFPYYKETLQMIEKMAKMIPTVRYVGWDISITDKGPVLIEANPMPGTQITQMPYPGGQKIGCMPKIEKALKGE